MSIFSRFRDIVNSNVNAMLEKAEDPEKLIRLMIQEMEETLIEMKASCAGTIATRKRSAQSLQHLKGRAADWEAKAKLAVSKGREDLAREALLQKRQATENAAALDREVGELDEIVQKYQADIRQLEEKLGTVREKQRVLAQRHLHARQKRRAEQQIRSADSTATMVRFDQFEQRIDRMEAEAELVNYGRKPTLEEEFEKLERSEEIEKELEALKQQAQRAPSSSSAKVTEDKTPTAPTAPSTPPPPGTEN
jgi:phage shock protein A